MELNSIQSNHRLVIILNLIKKLNNKLLLNNTYIFDVYKLL